MTMPAPKPIKISENLRFGSIDARYRVETLMGGHTLVLTAETTAVFEHGGDIADLVMRLCGDSVGALVRLQIRSGIWLRLQAGPPSAQERHEYGTVGIELTPESTTVRVAGLTMEQVRNHVDPFKI